jgi:hypothetical protein
MDLGTHGVRTISTGSMTIDKFDAYIEKHGVVQPYPGNIMFDSYGLYVLDRMIKHGRHICSMDKGLGKTAIALTAVSKRNTFPCIILTTKRGLREYIKEAEKWYPNWVPTMQIVLGTKNQRQAQWNTPGKSIFITTYASLLSDAGMRTGNSGNEAILPPWVLHDTKGYVLDEFHRVMRSRTSGMFKALKWLTSQPSVSTVYLLSGSAMASGPQDLWPALHLCDRKFWGSYWKYVSTFCTVDDSGWGKKITGAKNTQAWRASVLPYFTDVRKYEVAEHLPPKTRLPLSYELEPWQRKIYEGIMKEQLAEVSEGDFIIATNPLAALYKARLALICPKALDPALGYGGMLDAVYEDVDDNSINRFVIYTPFKAPIPFIGEFFSEWGYSIYTLQGGITEANLHERIAAWKRDPKAVLICTIEYAESFELSPGSDYCYFMGYAYDKERNEQAEDRLHRRSTINPIFCSYLQCDDTYDGDLWEHIMNKGFNVALALGKGDFIRNLLKGNPHYG